jgi:hypothetical protein
MNTIFSVENPKAAKSTDYGYLNAIHYMAPADTAGVGNLCSHASDGCKALCLGFYSGQAGIVADLEHGTNNTRDSRKAKARAFMHDRNGYLNEMVYALANQVMAAYKLDLTLCVRPNGATDLAFEKYGITLAPRTIRKIEQMLIRINAAPEMVARVRTMCAIRPTLHELFYFVQFIDYTKNPSRFKNPPSNLHLTFSRAENNWSLCELLLNAGYNVAAVFAGGLPEQYKGFPVINGDLHDLRHLDPRGGVIVGLTPKGRKAKADKSGFIIREMVAA